MNRSFNTPHNSKRLFDLISFKNNSFKIAFYFAIKDTLVCPNLDLATEIAFN